MFSKRQTSSSNIQSPFQSRQASWSSGGHANLLIGYLLWQNLEPLTAGFLQWKFQYPRVSPGDRPLTKKPEDDIGPTSCYTQQKHDSHFEETDGHLLGYVALEEMGDE